jgi:hypothetical protein
LLPPLVFPLPVQPCADVVVALSNVSVVNPLVITPVAHNSAGIVIPAASMPAIIHAAFVRLIIAILLFPVLMSQLSAASLRVTFA